MDENWYDWDEHMSTILFSYRTSFKVGTSYIPFQLVYELHPLLPIEYLLPSKPRQNHDPTHVRIITNKLSKLKKLEKNQLITQDLVAFNECYGLKINTLKPNINLEIMLYGFQRLSMHIPLSFRGDGLDLIRFNNVYLTILY